MGLIAWIYEQPERGRDALSVVPAGIDRVCLVNVAGPFEPADDMPAAMLEKGPFDSARVVMLDAAGERIPGVMKGYGYVASSDGRFDAAVSAIVGYRFYGAVALHDRKEW